MEIKDISLKVVEFAGGKENITFVTNCMTRVRINIKDLELVNVDELEKLPSVLGVVISGTLQIIVGPKSSKIATKINELFNFSGEVTGSDNNNNDEKKIKRILKSLSNVFIPLIPGMIAAGIILGTNNIIVQSANAEALKLGIEATSTLKAGEVVLDSKGLLAVTRVLGIIGSSLFSLLAVYTGIFSAKEFKATLILGGIIGAITISPQLKLIGVDPGTGGLIGIVFAVFLLAKIEKIIRNIIPDVVAIVLTPTITLLIMSLTLIFGIMPIAGVISDGLIGGIQGILENGGILAGFSLASLFPTLISLGLHHGLTPIHMELLNKTGTNTLAAVQIMSNAGMVGAAIAVLVMTRDEKMKRVAKGAIPTSILAVGEPTIFGVNIPTGFPFITGSIGAGFGGVMIILLDVKTTALGAAGVSAIPMIADGKYLQYISSWLVGATVAFTLTYVVGRVKKYQ